MDISIIGAGYVGLVTAAGLAYKGHRVILVDRDPNTVEQIDQGKCPFYEPGLHELLSSVPAGRLSVTADIGQALAATSITLITVGTPLEQGKINLTSIIQACIEIGRGLALKEEYHAVVVKSTVVPTTTERLLLPVLEAASGKKAGRGFGLCANPEFLREGAAVADFLQPDRIILGCLDDTAFDTLAQVYLPFTGVPLVRTNLRTAEMIKYASNAFFPTLISFTNEIAGIAEQIGGIDVLEVLQGVLLDHRFNPADGFPGLTAYLHPGCGFGGSCFPKDLGALVGCAAEHGYDASLLKNVLAVNQARPQRIVQVLEKALGGVKDRRIAVLGLSFKPDTDDTRGSPALVIITDLVARGAQIAAYDPAAMNKARASLSGLALEFATTAGEALTGADACVVVTAWQNIAALQPQDFVSRMRRPLVLDTRRVYRRETFQERVEYLGSGLG